MDVFHGTIVVTAGFQTCWMLNNETGLRVERAHIYIRDCVLSFYCAGFEMFLLTQV